MNEKPSRPAFTMVELLVVIAIIGILSGLVLVGVQKARASAARLECANHLRQVGLALQQYHAMERVFPPGITINFGNKPEKQLSWLARILPYAEQANLWRQIEVAFAHDPVAFHNPPHTALDTVIRIYTCPADARTSMPQVSFGHQVAFTSFLGNIGQNYTTRDGILFKDSQIRMADITDGTSNTLAAGERPPSADLYFGWWYAGLGQNGDGSGDMLLGVRELRSFHLTGCSLGPHSFHQGQLNNQCDLLHFWSLHAGGGHFLFVDGSVRFFSYGADPKLPALASRSGGEPILPLD